MVKRINDQFISAVIDIILGEFGFLESELLYSQAVKYPIDNLFIKTVVVEYLNDRIRRKIEVSFFQTKDDQLIFDISIIRTPYRDVKDFFSLDIYLKSLGEEVNVRMLHDFDESGAKIIVKKLSEILKKSALRILNGSIWLDNFFPRKD